MRRLGLLIASGLVAAHCSGSNVRDDARFSYENIYQDRYERGNGGIIPITLERGESYSGTITRDNRYLYFASNNSGNYDIYLRDLTDVFSVPVVQTVTNQREPAISPDGKYLVYVDDELDPDGDIILLKVNPKKLIELYRDRREPDDEWFASRSKNLTNSEKNRIRARDANPAWSPDGKWIAYSSDLDPGKADDLGAGAGALQNIWVMPAKDPEKKRRLTTAGGVMPSFSHDGQKIVYISYQDPKSLGAVYEIDIATEKTRKITSGKELDFYPSYAPEDEGIVLTRIASDSNGDGQIDRKDAGQIIRVYPDDASTSLSAGEGILEDDDLIPLTSRKDHVFDSRVSNFIGGSVLHAQVKGDDINVAFIPVSGSVPVRADIRQQVEFLQTYTDGKKFKQGYCSGYHQMPAAFGDSPDVVVYEALSDMRRARCDPAAAVKLKAYLAASDAEEIVLYRLFNDLSKFVPAYSDLKGLALFEPLASIEDPAEFFEAILKEKKLWQSFREDDNSDYLAILSFIRHEQALYFARQGKTKNAREVVQKIIRENPAYLAIDELVLQIGIADSATLPTSGLIYLITEKADPVLLRDYFRADAKEARGFTVRPHIRRKAEKFLLAFYEKQLTASNEEAQEQFLKSYPEKKYPMIHALFSLAAARDHAHEELYPDSAVAAARAKSLAPVGSIFQLYADIVTGGNAEITTGAEAAIAIYSEGIKNHRDAESPAEIKEVIQKISAYYKDKANLMRGSGNERAAAAEYQALIDLYLSAHSNKLTRELPTGDLLDFSLSLDQIAIKASATDKDLLEDILKFYDARIDLARRFLVTEFIFGRGFLRAQLGITRHLAAEADGLTKSEKKQVFEDFRKAETDLNWCFFANPRFADAYVMLGWMYQFIDEKREVVLESGSGKRDREVFESLYKTYFPDYLFEKNIRLYQKTLALFGQSGSPRVRNSFHLNIANNYFLLNNYSQAEEHYTAILDARGNPNYQFESPEQEMMFYYHLGRTLYFTGKNDAATRYLQYVENNLNSRYPLQGVSAEVQKINQMRRETAYKTFALNSEYAQNPVAAIAYNRAIVAERLSVGAETPVSMVYLELARLSLRQGDFNNALDFTNKAEAALVKEEKVPVPKFKLRIKWFWVYEPWTTMVGWIYKLSSDDVFIGENHLAFEMPTVNRYQLLYSIRADVFKNKGLLNEASQALAHLVEKAEQDKTKHGKETLSAAVNRRAEIEFQLKNWDAAQKLYETALADAEKSGNSGALLVFHKNVQLCRLRKLETDPGSVEEKIRMSRKYHDEIASYEARMIGDRIETNRKILKERNDPAKKDLTPEDVQKITVQVKSELQPMLFYKGLFLAHEAELIDFKERIEPRQEDFDQFLVRKKVSFDRFSSTLKYFRGYSKESFSEVLPEFEPDLKNNSLRMKLAMNRAKVLQEMNLFDESVAEFREIQEKSQEFRANLELAIASYRSYRVYEEAEAEDTVNIAPYQTLVRYFMQNQSFLRANTDLFERLCNILSDRALRKKNFAEAIRIEDQKRQVIGLQMYFDDLKLYGAKDELFSKLLIVEQKRGMLQSRIRAARLTKQVVPQQEKDLATLDGEAAALRRNLSLPDRLDYRYETFFSESYSDAELAAVADKGVLYAMRPRDDLVVVYVKAENGKKGRTWRYDSFLIDAGKNIGVELESIVAKTGAEILILNAQVLPSAIASESLHRLALQTTLRAQINFSNNPDRAKRNLLQLTKPTSLFSFGGSNAVDYAISQPLDRVKTTAEIDALPLHRNVVDYEAELARKTVLIDNSLLSPAALFSLRSNPNYIIASRQSRDKLQPADDFRYMTATDLYFSAMGAGQVLHTFARRSDAKPGIEAFLNSGAVGAGTILTGNANLLATRDKSDATKGLAEQKKSYLKKIDVARRQREYTEAISYAEDALSLLPGDFDLIQKAAELQFTQKNHAAGLAFMQQLPSAASEPLSHRKDYARLLLRSGNISGFDQYVAADAGLKTELRRDGAEFEGLTQLAAFSKGDISSLDARTSQTLAKTVKNDELRNEICNAALAALEYRLVINSCLAEKYADVTESIERARVRDWFDAEKKAVQKTISNDDLEFLRAISMVQSGFVSDSLVPAKKYLMTLRQTPSEHLLAFAFLRVLAERKTNGVDAKAIGAMLSLYGREAVKKSQNLQTQRFYTVLATSENMLAQGEDAVPQSSDIVATSGLVSAQNLSQLLALSVKPGSGAVRNVQSSGLRRDKDLEAELQFYQKAASGYSEDIDCAVHSCGLLVKRHLALGDVESALFLTLRSQKAVQSKKSIRAMPTGAYGYAEFFNDEAYEWRYDGKAVQFERLAGFDEKTAAKVGSDRRYLVMGLNKNLYLKHKIAPPREVTLLDANAPTPRSTSQDDVIIFAGESGALYSSLIATWGKGKKSQRSYTLQIKAPFTNAAGEFHIYTDRVALGSISELKPHGYHLFCESTESLSGFINFAQKVVENMVTQRMPVEAAYEAAFKSLKGIKASGRPLYYLYRN